LRNELRMFTQRLGIHLLSGDIKNPCHFECPHRLSDKLLKSSAASLFPAGAGVQNVSYTQLTLPTNPGICISGGGADQ
ncbi:hypothetical protein ACVGWG_00345, partial [Enterobacter asburiae]